MQQTCGNVTNLMSLRNASSQLNGRQVMGKVLQLKNICQQNVKLKTMKEGIGKH